MTDGARSDRLSLPQVTLCAVTSVNVKATVRALEASLAQVDFAACTLFCDVQIWPDHPAITMVPIRRLTSAAAYSDFILSELVDHVETSHCLVVQWDGHVLDSGRWRPEFLDYDYIGASWPQFDDGHDVGNGGFSLRSRRLMEACRDPDFRLRIQRMSQLDGIIASGWRTGACVLRRASLPTCSRRSGQGI